jgi:hypothetical protein
MREDLVVTFNDDFAMMAANGKATSMQPASTTDGSQPGGVQEQAQLVELQGMPLVRKKSILKMGDALENGPSRAISWSDQAGKELHTVKEFVPRCAAVL